MAIWMSERPQWANAELESWPQQPPPPQTN
jgi:hypothetical protein